MAASMWRMNGLWRRMAGLLLLCALLLSNEVMCQDDQATDAPGAPTPDSAAGAAAATDAPGSAADSDATAPPAGDSAPTVSVMTGATLSAAPVGTALPATLVSISMNPDSQDGGSAVTSAPPSAGGHDVAVPRVIQDTAPVVQDVVPNVKCVSKEDIPEDTAVTVEVETDNCEATKRIIENNPAKWGCHTAECNLEIFQNGNTMLVATKNAKLNTVADVLVNEPLKAKLGVKKAQRSSSSGSSVFVGILVTGLLAALAITIGYFKCQRRSDGKGVRLAEEAYPVDQENQGNTLVSVAPLNPPPETPEKPSVNGESPEAAKTQPPPPTNGHSTTKTADTEL